MNAFFNARTRRSTAYVVLLAWLFALASGVANACLLEARGAHERGPPTSHLASTSAASEFSEGAIGEVAGHGTDSDASPDSCLKACDDGSHALIKEPSGQDLSDPGAAPTFAIAWPPVTAAASAPSRWGDLRPATSDPPIRVRFSRLAL